MVQSETPQEMDSSSESWESGFSWRTIAAILYAVVVFQAAAIYIYLMTASMAMMAGLQWATLVLFVELARRYGHPLTRQEAAVVYMGSALISQFMLFMAFGGIGTGGGAGAGSLPMGWVYQAYMKHSPVTAGFLMSDQIPSFYSPPLEVWVARTFLDPAWIPIAISTFVWWICALTADISLGLIMFNLYVVEEKLPFPLAQPTAQACITLTGQTEESDKKVRLMVTMAVVSFLYSFILYGANFLWIAWGYPGMLLPIPWFDFNRTLHLVFAGVSLGFATDAALFATGFIIPFKITAAIFVGSFALYFVGNFLLVNLGLTAFAEEWAFGMSVANSWQRSVLHVWAVPIIGVSIAVGLVPLLRRPRSLIATFKGFRSSSRTEKRGYPLWLPLVLFLAATTALSLYGYMLSPGFPIWLLLLLNIPWSFTYALIAGRASGVAMPFAAPYVRELVYASSGYTGYDIWFTPVYTNPSAAWVNDFKVCELTKTRLMSFVKALLLMWPVAFILGLLLTQNFWSMQPIPSLAYPGVDFAWPVTNSVQLLFATRASEYFHIEWLIYGFAIAAVLYVVLDFFHLGPLLIGGAVGLITPIPTALTIFAGGLLGYIIGYIWSEKWWSENKALVAAGIMLGEGVLLVIATAVAVIIRSLWALPY